MIGKDTITEAYCHILCRSGLVRERERKIVGRSNGLILKYLIYLVFFLVSDVNITLWQFLLELLQNPEKKDIISWTNDEGQFKLHQAEEVARLWGLRKNKTNMNYDKLSRALLAGVIIST